MGAGYPHFHITSLSYIVCTQKVDILKIIEVYQRKYSDSDEFMKVTIDILSEILIDANIHESGCFDYS
jgi:hypothetical protein